MKCNYGCGQNAKFQLKNGKWCCCKSQNSCPEMKKKNSESQKGEKSPNFGKKCPEHSERMKAYGENHIFKNPEFINKYCKGENNRAKKPEVREKLKGKNHWNWQGGISCEPYCPLWTDKEYKNWMRYERDENKCQNPNCSGFYKKIVIHHINYDKKDCRPVNLITLCASCNSKANYNRELHKTFYQELMKKRNIK